GWALPARFELGNDGTRSRRAIGRRPACAARRFSSPASSSKEGGTLMSRARLHGGFGRILVVLLWLASLSQAPALEQKGKAPEAEQTMPEVRDLFPSETIHFAAPPPLMVDSGIKCDRNGNIYLVY